MDKEQLKAAVCKAIDANRERIYEIGKTILKNPELGFKEFKTSALVKAIFKEIGVSFEESLAITGVKGRLKGKEPGLRVAVIGELDAVVCPSHPYADPDTGAAHACGHNAQIASMLGAAFGLLYSGAMKELSGEAIFFAVPAEEFVEIEYRANLKDKGAISFLGGKQELIATGAFDDVDMAMMVHAQSNCPEPMAYINTTTSAFIAKTVVFTGKEAHAGGFPHLGVNALNAASGAMMLIHSLRETFREGDGIRVHPIITKGGDLVNIVPADVRMETHVRGNTMEGAAEANKKVNRAIRGAAYAVGASVTIKDLPGYLTLVQESGLTELYTGNILPLVGKENLSQTISAGGATDMGDLSLMMPCIHPFTGGFGGHVHNSDFSVVNEEVAYLYPAKAMALTVVDLLFDGGKEAQALCSAFKPAYTKESYVRFLNAIAKTDEGSDLV